MLRRYLTPFYVFTLGLVLTLAFTACGGKGSSKIGVDITTKEAISIKTVAPTQASIPGEISGTPTILPAIPATPNENTPSPLGITANDLHGLQVNLWHPWSGEQAAVFQGILDEFTRTNQWEITVQARSFEGFGRLDDAVESARQTGTLPDLLIDYGYQAQHWDGTGLLADLAPYINDPVWGLTGEEQDDFFKTFWAEDVVKDDSSQTRRIGIPYYRSAYVMFYNQSWGEELGYPTPPQTPEDFRVRACSAAEAFASQGDKTNLGKGGYLVTPRAGELAGWIYAFGGQITNPYAPGYLFNTAETNQAFTYLKGLQGSGCAWFDTEGDPRVEFANRQALFMVGSLYDIPAQKAAFTAGNNNDKWIIISFPSSLQPVIDTYGPSLLMMQSSKAQQLATWLVMEWLVYPPNQAKWVQELEVYPTRQSSVSILGNISGSNPEWAQAMNLITDAHAEPTLASWSSLRWALEDTARQLFSQQFIVERVPELVRDLDILAAEVFDQVH